MSSSGSFFPRIESVFYAVFDVRQGPKIVYQVPEGLIATGQTAASSSSGSLASLSPISPLPTDSPSLQRSDSHQPLSPRKDSLSSHAPLFHFDDISKYVMPPSALCGRLVICATRKHRVIGFPVELRGIYERNYFRYNLCFVFERHADLSCYEPIVRKVSRVLTACEEESKFLSSEPTSPAIHAILEQLYEDLNSYSETSIPVNQFNSIELKIFPFYPNPPPVKDWMVPLALINLTKRIKPNWDLTMVKVCQYIDGTNHVSRIARLADCDLDLTRQAIAHLLYYQVIMMIDIFQYSNMYTLRTSIQWLADEPHVRDECGPYATKPGEAIADWPRLLHLYSRLKPGRTVREWMVEHDVPSHGIDVRRFTSFGVIKGFLRRVHRWPILLPEASTPRNEQRTLASSLGRKRGKSFSATFSATTQPSQRLFFNEADSARTRGRSQDPQPSRAISMLAAARTSTGARTPDVLSPPRRPSAAESSLEQLRSRNGPPPRRPLERIFEPTPPATTQTAREERPPQPPAIGTLLRPRVSRSPSAPAVPSGHVQALAQAQVQMQAQVQARAQAQGQAQAQAPMQIPYPVPAGPSFPPALLPLLDGEHHTDELCTRFEVGWPILRQWLVLAGGGKGDDDFGRVAIIYR
ncbi:NPR2-domain-containing protein [Wolfiporia cocos MD-104 SS10]|uniref:NPR2-domain-containing protein n=1 Tax=Wolfiporia cocos (strain MD-104) TaxID=742152 RepID=A0A2H3JDV0_WOLCO|nr:NPR2-domain-containing protein [Wolfiporia cocos MD-104 SS10]